MVTRPKFVIYVNIDEPQTQYYGGLVAGPLFSEIASHALRTQDESSYIKNLAVMGGFQMDSESLQSTTNE
jgi:hypothetical protein